MNPKPKAPPYGILQKTRYQRIYLVALRNGETRYRVRLDFGGVRTWKTVRTLPDAHSVLAAARSAQPIPQAPSGGVMLFGEAADLYFKSYEVRAAYTRNFDRVRSLLRSLCRVFGDTPISQISPELWDAYTLQRRAQGVGPVTVNLEGDYLHAVLKMAHKRGRLASVPELSKLDYPRTTPRRELDDAEIETICRQASPQHRACLLASLQCGIRPGEFFRLEPADLRETPRGAELRIRHAKNRRERTIPIRPETAAIIAKQFAANNGRTTPHPRETAFTSHCLYERERKIRGIARPWSLYDGRHTFATRMGRTPGVDVFSLSRILGHSNIRQTMRYVHTDLNDMRAAMEREQQYQCGGTSDS